MTDLPMYLPISYSKKRNLIETIILDFSKKIFANTKIGIIYAIIFNCIYIYSCYYKYSLISIFILFYLFYLVYNIIIYQFSKNK